MRDVQRASSTTSSSIAAVIAAGSDTSARLARGAATHRVDLLDQRVETVALQPDRRDVGSFTGGAERGRPADAALRPGDEHDPTGEPGRLLVSHGR